MSATLGTGVVDDGVETPSQAHALADLDCPPAPGYLWSPARPPADFLELLRQGARHGRSEPATDDLAVPRTTGAAD